MKDFFCLVMFGLILSFGAISTGTQTQCPGGLGQVFCFIDPCRKAYAVGCLGYPDAKCVPSFCGGCHHRWYAKDGTEVFCN